MTLLALLLALGLLDGVPADEQARARPILASARRGLEEHFRTLGFVPTLRDRWPEVTERVREGRRSTWESWKRELEWNAALLAGYPGAALRTGALAASDGESERQLAPAHLVWLEDAPRVLLGEDEVAPDLAYGYQRVGPAWFFCVRTELELAGAPSVSAALAALERREGHWFERQLLVYQALLEVGK